MEAYIKVHKNFILTNRHFTQITTVKRIKLTSCFKLKESRYDRSPYDTIVEYSDDICTVPV